MDAFDIVYLIIGSGALAFVCFLLTISVCCLLLCCCQPVATVAVSGLSVAGSGLAACFRYLKTHTPDRGEIGSQLADKASSCKSAIASGGHAVIEKVSELKAGIGSKDPGDVEAGSYGQMVPKLGGVKQDSTEHSEESMEDEAPPAPTASSEADINDEDDVNKSTLSTDKFGSVKG